MTSKNLKDVKNLVVAETKLPKTSVASVASVASIDASQAIKIIVDSFESKGIKPNTRNCDEHISLKTTGTNAWLERKGASKKLKMSDISNLVLKVDTKYFDGEKLAKLDLVVDKIDCISPHKKDTCRHYAITDLISSDLKASVDSILACKK